MQRRAATRRGIAAFAVALAVGGGVAVATAGSAAALDVDERGILVWGDNTWGQMGNGGIGVDVPTPTPVVPGGLVFTSLSTGGGGTTTGLLADGTAYAWGSNESGQFGNGTSGATSTTPTPVSQPDGVRFTAVAVGEVVTLALDTTGGVWGWGQSLYGVLGASAPDDVLTPLRIPFPAGIVVTEIFSSTQAAYAIDANGGIWAWGTNTNAQLAQPDAVDVLTVPTPVALPDGAQLAQLDVGTNSVLARTTDGRVFGWGQNQLAQLGISTGIDADGFNTPEDVFAVTPVSVLDGLTAVDVSTSGLQSFALLADGSVHGWGDNGFGELGTGAATSFVTTSVVPALPADVQVVEVVAAVGASYARTADGQLYAWGSNGAGSLGDGTETDRATPGAVLLPAGARIDGLEVVVDTVFAALLLPPILVDALPSAVVGEPYRAVLGASGTSPVSFAVTAGTLPDGLALDAVAGVVSGRPTAGARTTAVTVMATNAAGSASREYRITVSLPATGLSGGGSAWAAGWGLAALVAGASLATVSRRGRRAQRAA